MIRSPHNSIKVLVIILLRKIWPLADVCCYSIALCTYTSLSAPNTTKWRLPLIQKNMSLLLSG